MGAQGRPLKLQLSAAPVDSSISKTGVPGGEEPKLAEYKLLVDCVCYEGKVSRKQTMKHHQLRRFSGNGPVR